MDDHKLKYIQKFTAMFKEWQYLSAKSKLGQSGTDSKVQANAGLLESAVAAQIVNSMSGFDP